MTTPAEAFAAGLTISDLECVALFDIDPSDYVARAKAKKPEWFGFDARTAPAVEVEARLKQLTEIEPARRRAADRTAETVAALREGR